MITQADLAEALEDELFALRESLGSDAFPKSASNYLNDWADSEKGWLRKWPALFLWCCEYVCGGGVGDRDEAEPLVDLTGNRVGRAQVNLAQASSG